MSRIKNEKSDTVSRVLNEPTTITTPLQASRDNDVTSMDATKSSVSASSLVLAALSAAEQDLGANLSNIETNDIDKTPLTPLDIVDHSKKEINTREQDDRNMLNTASLDNNTSVTISAYSETQVRGQDIQEKTDSTTTAFKDNNDLPDKSVSSVTITPHTNDMTEHQEMNECSKDAMYPTSSENRTSTDYEVGIPSPKKVMEGELDNESCKAELKDRQEENINNLPNGSSPSRTPTANAVDIIPVPNTNESTPENASTFEEYPNKNALYSNYNKMDIESSTTFSSAQLKSPPGRQSTPSNSLIEAHSHHLSNSRSPSSLPPPPTTPHFPANSYPAHFPSTDLAQFSNQLYHSGLDTLARSCYPTFRSHSNSTPTDYSTFSRSSAPSVDFMPHSIPPSPHEGIYAGGGNGMSNFPNVNTNGTSTGLSSSPSSSSLDLSQTSSSSAAAIAAAAVADMLPSPTNPRSPFGNNSSASHLSPFYSSHCNMINEHLLNVATGPKDLTSPRLPPSHAQSSTDNAGRQSTNPYMHQNYSLYESSRFPTSASSVGYPAPPTPPNNHNRLPHISPAASPYHHYGYFQ